MKKITTLFIHSLLATLILGFGISFGADNIVTVTPDKDSVDCYKPVFVTILTTKNFSNGFNPDEIKLDCEITGPAQEAISLPCFYKATVNGQAQWQARFAPRNTGSFTYKIALTQGSTTIRSNQFNLFSRAAKTNGYIHIDSTTKSMYTFRFDNGKVWRGIGENIAWEAGGSYSTQFPRLAATGCNMVRMWHCNWHMPFEWNSAPNIYNTGTADYMDQVVSLAENNGIYLMVMMNDYRDFSEQWGSNPYNTSKGGWCNSDAEFFSNANAIACYKKRIRYYVARWGYSQAIQSWEFFNEIDNAFGTSVNAALGSWCDTMSRCFHTLDIYNHLVTASVSWQSTPQMWNAPNMDFTQAHLYGPETSNPVWHLPSQAQQYITSYKKPYVCGEFSRRWESANSEPSINYRNELHYGMYLGMVNSTPIAPLTWWWDSHWSWGDDFVFKSAAGYSNDIIAKTATTTIGKLAVTSTGNTECGGIRTGNSTNFAYVWVSNYRGSASASNVTATITGLPTNGDGKFTVEWYDTWNGGFGAATTVNAANGTLTLNIGTLANGNGTSTDKACRITNLNIPDNVLAHSDNILGEKQFGFRKTGNLLAIFGNFARANQISVSLFDMKGRAILEKHSMSIVNNSMEISTKTLPSQFYILKIKADLRVESFKIAL